MNDPGSTPPAGARRIAVLFHKGDRFSDLSIYIVHHLARFWREDGHEVVYLFGPRRFVPADLVLVHVNLSVVPDAYLELAARYPVALNGRIRDIRKTAISENLVRPGDGWGGPVIVKSDLNYAGQPEQVLRRTWLERRWRPSRRVRRLRDRLTGNTVPFGDADEYKVFDHVGEVPEQWLSHRHVVIEKFLPEIEDDLYHLRIYQFLGDRATCSRLASPGPVIKAQTSVRTEPVAPHPEVIAWREALGFDYGKLDYVVHDGKVVLLDANKTTGASSHISNEALEKMRRHQAEGLYSCFR